MKQPQFDRLTIHSPLWRENAESLRFAAEKRTQRMHRLAFPFILIAFIAAVIRLTLWAINLNQ